MPVPFDRGGGPPLVVVPGLQGRWEWSKPALGALARRCRTISYSLCGDIGSGRRLDAALGFENYLRQLDDLLDEAGIQRAAICGVSFGGFIAVRYAAARPDRVASLILASAPGPGFEPSPQQTRWLTRPWLSAPAFIATSPLRIWPEVRAAIPEPHRRALFLATQAARCAAAPMVPSLMASRMRGTARLDFAEDCRRLQVPTLVISGEDSLDRVVPPASTRRYASLIPDAVYRVMPRTGHMGLLTRPADFADLVSGFVHAHHH